LIFIHGGYWAALSAEDSLYLGPAALRAGWSFAAVEYTLAPAAGLPRMIEECRAALTLIASEAAAASSVVVAGHSAGAHLAAMTTLVETPSVEVARTVLVSGVFDLRPLVHTTVNDPLQLDEVTAASLSPALLASAHGSLPEIVLAWGDNDTTAFAEQSRAYAAKLAAAGNAVTARECRGRHHFDILADLVDPASELGELTLGGQG
jgi:arylformamidase